MQLSEYVDEYGREILIKGETQFRLTNLEDSSAKYGDCEICKKHCSEIYLQTKLEFYDFPEDDASGWSYAGQGFGHKDCLISLRNKE